MMSFIQPYLHWLTGAHYDAVIKTLRMTENNLLYYTIAIVLNILNWIMSILL